MMEMMMGALMGGGPGGVGMLLGGKGKGKARKAAKRAERAPAPEPDEGDEDGGDEEAGAFRLVAVTKSQRIRKNMDKLYRALDEIEGLMGEIEEMESKLDALGDVDVNELYDSWNAGEVFAALAAWAQERAGGGASSSGYVVGHVDDLSDEEIEALQSGALAFSVGGADDEG